MFGDYKYTQGSAASIQRRRNHQVANRQASQTTIGIQLSG
jgi:hypothetical protein